MSDGRFGESEYFERRNFWPLRSIAYIDLLCSLHDANPTHPLTHTLVSKKAKSSKILARQADSTEGCSHSANSNSVFCHSWMPLKEHRVKPVCEHCWDHTPCTLTSTLWERTAARPFHLILSLCSLSFFLIYCIFLLTNLIHFLFPPLQRIKLCNLIERQKTQFFLKQTHIKGLRCTWMWTLET